MDYVMWRCTSLNSPNDDAILRHPSYSILEYSTYVYQVLNIAIPTQFFLSFFLRFLSSPFCRSPCPIAWSFFVRFCPLVLSFSVRFLYPFLRFYFRFPAFLCGEFCYSVISSRRYTPRALLASLKYAYCPCAPSSFLRCWCWFIFFFSDLPLLFRFRFGRP